MQLLICLLVLTIGTNAAATCNNITVTSTWSQPPTLVTAKCASSYVFNIPDGYYANVDVKTIDAEFPEVVALFDNTMQSFQFEVTGHDHHANVNFPSSFNVKAQVIEKDTKMKIEISVTVKKLIPTSVTQVATNANKQPTVIYLKDWVPGTAYTFTSSSSSSRIAILVDPYFPTNDLEYQVLMNNVFISEGGVNKDTLLACSPITSVHDQCVSQSKEVTLTLVDSIPLPGAILVTDYDNVKYLDEYHVEYVPNGAGAKTANFDGAFEKPIPAAFTVIGEQTGSTPITVAKTDNYNDGGVFTYLSGGPVANYGVVASPLSKKDFPKTISGRLITFMVSTGEGTVVYHKS